MAWLLFAALLAVVLSLGLLDDVVEVIVFDAPVVPVGI